MGVAYTVSDQGRFVELVIAGRVTGWEIIEQKLAMSRDRAIAEGYSELCDATGVTSVELEPGFMERAIAAAQANQDAHRNVRTAIVVNRPVLFDLSRQYERVVAELGITVIVFKHRDTALLWLGRWQPGDDWHRRAEQTEDREREKTRADRRAWGRGHDEEGDGSRGGSAGDGAGLTPPRLT